MAINSVGLESAIGFLHDASDYPTKESLAYDLQEPFRWLVDVTVIQGFESGIIDTPDFYFTADDYHYRFEMEAKQRFIDALREQFNSGVNYKGRTLKWDTVIEQKLLDLGRYLVGKSPKLDFTEPSPVLQRSDSRELRQRINSLTSQEARKLGIPKQTLHDLKKRARSEPPFRTYGKVSRKLQVLS